MAKANRYQALISKIFFDGYSAALTEFTFERDALSQGATQLGIDLPKNLGDVIYSVRFRTALPDDVLATQPPGMEWIIEGAGRSSYRFKLVRINRIVPRADLIRIAIPDATPEIATVKSEQCFSPLSKNEISPDIPNRATLPLG